MTDCLIDIRLNQDGHPDDNAGTNEEREIQNYICSLIDEHGSAQVLEWIERIAHINFLIYYMHPDEPIRTHHGYDTFCQLLMRSGHYLLRRVHEGADFDEEFSDTFGSYMSVCCDGSGRLRKLVRWNWHTNCIDTCHHQ